MAVASGAALTPTTAGDLGAVGAIWKSGYYYTARGARSTFSLALNRMSMVRVDTPLGASITKLCCEVTTGGATGCVVRLGVFAADALTLLAEASATIDATTTGAKEASMTTPLAVGGPVWLAAVVQGATCTMRTAGAAGDGLTGAVNLANAMGANAVTGYAFDSVSGALATQTEGSRISQTQAYLVGAVAA